MHAVLALGGNKIAGLSLCYSIVHCNWFATPESGQDRIIPQNKHTLAILVAYAIILFGFWRLRKSLKAIPLNIFICWPLKLQCQEKMLISEKHRRVEKMIHQALRLLKLQISLHISNGTFQKYLQIGMIMNNLAKDGQLYLKKWIFLVKNGGLQSLPCSPGTGGTGGTCPFPPGLSSCLHSPALKQQQQHNVLPHHVLL